MKATKLLLLIAVLFLTASCSKEKGAENSGGATSSATANESAKKKIDETEIISLNDLKLKYTNNEELSAKEQMVVDSLISVVGNCDCLCCGNSVQCAAGSGPSCSVQKNVPCTWCCP